MTIHTASLVNHLSGTNPELVPTVGMGATELLWTDRRAYTVVEVKVSPSGKTVTVVVQADKATRIDGNGMSECQTYEYTADPAGERVTLRRNKRGQWVSKSYRNSYGDLVGGGRRFALGYRNQYHDYSF